MKKELKIALSTDERGFVYNATLIASILRRTDRSVHVRCWCRGFLPESFETGRLKVEFLPAVEDVTGVYPWTSGPAAYDRLLVIRDCPDWDRCMVMDYDQLALCDMAPLFDLDLGDHLLAAHMQGPGVDMAYAMREWVKRPIPEEWEHVAEHPYFLMPPMLNLKAMREAGTWEHFLKAHTAFGADEQLSLTAATEGRTLPLDAKWNLFPKLHIIEGEVPEGIIHWCGWPKPWHKGAKVWRPDIWLAEEVSWEHLRMGIWEKPLAVELEPEDGAAIRGLLDRGWRVEVATAAPGEPHQVMEELGLKSFPDLKILSGGAVALADRVENDAADMVRLGQWTEVDRWLDGVSVLPQYLAVCGCPEPGGLAPLGQLGYYSECRLQPGEWPSGGPLPRVMEYSPLKPDLPPKGGEVVYLKRDATVAPPAGVFADTARFGRQPSPEACSVGVLVIATAKYKRYVRPLLASIRRNFLPDHAVTVFLFTDGDFPEETGLRVIPVAHSSWPGMAIRRHSIFREHAKAFAGIDYLFYLDADMRVISRVGDEILGDRVAIIHPGFHDQPREKFTYERRPESSACIQPWEGSRYYCSGVQGGKTEVFLAAVAGMAEQIDADEARGIMAVWHDESHWNRYLVDHPPTVELSPSYCWYPDGRSAGFEGRISVVLKDAREMRAE